ncbi:MAG TPA: aldehyde dehydrogenase family protein [Acidimicrobiales bacterium]|nr:aldehyde dehydrogenase family protein [Acidimicrobiales bacterium]
MVTDVEEPGFETLDPRTGEVLGHLPEHGPADVVAAVARAREAFGAWSALAFEQRLDHVLAVRDLLIDRIDRIVDVICKETGKLEPEALSAEVLATCELIEHYRKHGARALRSEKVPVGSLLPHKRAWRSYEPMGVVGVISPWNYPLTLAMTPVVSALLAGNTVVLKPSEVTPLVGLEIGELFAEAGSHPDVVQVVTGGGRTGDALVRAGAQKVAFTGSVRTGKLVMAAAAETLTPVLLELGGKDPMIVCDDADIERAASGAVWGAFMNAGQTCMSVERVYVEDPVYDRFVDLVVDRAKAVRQGRGPRARHRVDELRSPGRDGRAPRRRRRSQGRQDPHRRSPGAGPGGAVVRADGPGGRRPFDGHHARRDLRPGPADHAGP